MNKGATVYSVDMKAANDLLAPSKKARVDTFLEMYARDSKVAKELGDCHKSDWHYVTPLPKKFYEFQYSRLNTKKLNSKGYDTFVRAIGGNEYLRDEYFKALSKKGYNFVTDDMDAGRFGKEPSIVFDREKDLFYIDQTAISAKEIREIWKKEGTYLKK